MSFSLDCVMGLEFGACEGVPIQHTIQFGDMGGERLTNALWYILSDSTIAEVFRQSDTHCDLYWFCDTPVRYLSEKVMVWFLSLIHI